MSFIHRSLIIKIIIGIVGHVQKDIEKEMKEEKQKVDQKKTDQNKLETKS